MLTDPIADMLTRIRNALGVRHDTVSIPASKTKIQMAKILQDQGFVKGYQVLDTDAPQATIKISLDYLSHNGPTMTGLKRVSRPGLRVYVGKNEIPRYYGGLGVAIISTSKGIMTGSQAWHKGIGGELLCYVW